MNTPTPAPINETFIQWQARMNAEGITIEGSEANAFSLAKAKARREAEWAKRDAAAAARRAARTPEQIASDEAFSKYLRNHPDPSGRISGYAANH